MSIEELKSSLPGYAKDLKLNLSGLDNAPGLSPQQLWGAALATAIASRSAEVTRAISNEAAKRLEPAAVEAAKAAAAVMAMNNVYYRATHLIGDDAYGKLPARLRMTVIGKPGVDRLDFELWCLAVSAVNGCGACLQSHERVLMDKGASKEMVQEALRIASIVHSVAVTLEGEEALGPVGRELSP